MISASAFSAEQALEKEWRECFESLLRPLLQQADEHALGALLQAEASKSAERARAVALALTYGMLSCAEEAALFLRLLRTDDRPPITPPIIPPITPPIAPPITPLLWSYALTELLTLTLHFAALAKVAKQQLRWLLGQPAALRASGSERLFVCLLRHVGTADRSKPALWLRDNLCSLLGHHLPWIS